MEENRSDSCQQVKSPFLKFLQGTVRFLDLSVKEPDYPKFPQGTVVRFPYLSVGEPDHPRKRPRLIFKVSPPILPANIAWLHALIAFTVLLPFVTKHALRLAEVNGNHSKVVF